MPRVSDDLNSSIAKSRQVIADDGAGAAERNALRTAVIESATAMRGAPCDPALKRAYLSSVTAYTRAKLKAVKDDYAASEVQWSTLLDKHVVQTLAQQTSDGLVSESEQMKAIMAHDLVSTAFWRANALRGEIADDGEKACARFERGEAIAKLVLKDPRKEPAPTFRRDPDEARDQVRTYARKAALKALSVAPSDLCDRPSKERLVEGLEGYWDKRSGELWNAEHVRQRDVEATQAAWQSPADLEIEAKIVDLIRRGHLTKRDIIKRQRDEYAPLFARAGPAARTCA